MRGLDLLLARWRRDCDGANAVEFALILPVLVVMLVGAMRASQMAGAISGMNYAVAEAARCSAVNHTVCPTGMATEAYARARYNATATDPLFVATTNECGFNVSATATFELNLAISKVDVPLTATACFPGVEEEA